MKIATETLMVQSKTMGVSPDPKWFSTGLLVCTLSYMSCNHNYILLRHESSISSSLDSSLSIVLHFSVCCFLQFFILFSCALFTIVYLFACFLVWLLTLYAQLLACLIFCSAFMLCLIVFSHHIAHFSPYCCFADSCRCRFRVFGVVFAAVPALLLQLSLLIVEH